MPRPKKNNYFGEEEEKALVEYLESDSYFERNKIYNSKLKAPMDKMVEGIIGRYQLFRDGMSYEELHADALNQIIIKYDKFKPESGKKAYSYYGTICRNYLINEIRKDKKRFRQNDSFDNNIKKIETKDEYMYEIQDVDYHSALSKMIIRIRDEVKTLIEDGGSDKYCVGVKKKRVKLNNNERIVGEALVLIFDNWKTLFKEFDDSGPKFSRRLVLYTLRETTRLDDKEIRNAMKRYNILFDKVKQSMIENGEL